MEASKLEAIKQFTKDLELNPDNSDIDLRKHSWHILDVPLTFYKVQKHTIVYMS